MKKLRNLFLIAVACLVSILFTDRVFAAVVEYPVYSGENINMDNKNYLISEDDGINDDEIRLTNTNDSNDTFLIKKSKMASGFVASATKNVDLKFQDVEAGVIESSKLDGVTKVVYLKDRNEIIDAIKNAKEYDNIYSDTINLYGENITIPENVTITTEYLIEVDSMINNGIIKTRNLFDRIGKISGSGIINLSYTDGDGVETDEIPKEWNESYRMRIGNISGVKINVIDVDIREGLGFGYMGSVSETTKEEAQKIIDMYNKVLGDTLNGYEVKLMVGKIAWDDVTEEYYYGSLVKNESNTSAKKPLTSTGKIKGSIEFANSISNNYVLDIKSIEVKKDLANKDVKYIVDISVLENGLVVKIDNNKMKIKIAIPEELKGYKKYEVVYISEDKIKETIPATIEDGYIVFETSHLSEYGIIAKEKQGVKNPKTGDTILYIVGAIILSASALVVSYKKIRQN